MKFHLKAARVNAHLTQLEAIEKLNEKGVKITKNTLSNYESYRTKPGIETAKTLAALYGLSVDDIIFYAE